MGKGAFPTYTIAIPMVDTTFISSVQPTTNYYESGIRAIGVTTSIPPAVIKREHAQVNLLAAHPWLADMDLVSAKFRRIVSAMVGAARAAACRRCTTTWIADEATWSKPFDAAWFWPNPCWTATDQAVFDLPTTIPAGQPFDLDITSLAVDALAHRSGLLNLVTMLQVESGADGMLSTESGQQGTTLPVVMIEFSLPGGKGYEVYCQNSVPVPGVDTPVAWLPPSASPSIDLAESGLDLQPNATYHLAVAAVNEFGRSATWPTFSFQTDNDAHPMQTPTPVHGLTATPRAGGGIDVRWIYDELTSLAVADEFGIIAVSLTDTLPPFIVDVPAQPPRRDYMKTLPLPGDFWRISVFSKRQGESRSPVSGVDISTVSEPPGTVIGLTAEEVE